MWCADIEKWVADLAVEGLLFVKVSTKLDIHSLLTGSAAGPLARSEIDPAHRAFNARGPTKPNFQRPDGAGRRCKCRLVCEWVCTVTSVSVQIEKRANCAKNNKPKSGGLFLVNARPFPEHSSSRATFSAGRAWLEANPTGDVAHCIAMVTQNILECVQQAMARRQAVNSQKNQVQRKGTNGFSVWAFNTQFFHLGPCACSLVVGEGFAMYICDQMRNEKALPTVCPSWCEHV